MPVFETVGFAPNFVDYDAGWQLQREVHSQVASGQREDTVLLLEHGSVYTAGKRTENEERPNDGTPVIDVDRGGKITWHGPGQLVGYPIMKLPNPIDVVGYVRWLEQVLIDTVATFGLVAVRVDGRKRPRKNCSNRHQSRRTYNHAWIRLELQQQPRGI